MEVRFAVVRVVGAGGDELVDGTVFLVVAGVDDDLPGFGDVYGGVLMPDTPEPGVLARFRARIERVYLYYPAVVLGGLSGSGIVEPAVGVGDLQCLGGVIGALTGLALIVCALAVEVLEVFLTAEHGIPGGDPAAAVGEGAYHLVSTLHPHLGGSGGGSRYVHRGGRIYAAVVLVVLPKSPGVALLLPPDDRAAPPRLLACYLSLCLFGRALGVGIIRPEHRIYVLVID